MPELPEVEYTRRQLQRAMTGACFDRVITRRAGLRYPFEKDFASRLEGRRVRTVRRRAKYLLTELATGDVLLMHLGMSGSFRVIRGGTPADDVPRASLVARRFSDAARPAYQATLDTHDHVVFEMSNGRVVIFNDPRRFGFMSFVQASDVATHATLRRLGPEPLERRFDAAALATELGRRKTSLKMALSDQRVIAGLGNIYVSEALHRARLSPRRRASTLVTRSGKARPAVYDLVKAIREVLKDAIRHQYRAGAHDPFLVYDREGKPCLRDGCVGMIRRIVQGGRSTFYCPVCQK